MAPKSDMMWKASLLSWAFQSNHDWKKIEWEINSISLQKVEESQQNRHFLLANIFLKLFIWAIKALAEESELIYKRNLPSVLHF